MDFSDYFKGKRITVMGLGLLGRGVGDAAYLAEAGAAEVLVTDLKSEVELKDSVEQLQQYENVKFVLGEHRIEDFVDRDFILVGAGVPTDSEYLLHAREARVPLKQSAALFAELTKIPIIGVTGTRGKSTVTQMIHHVLSQATGEPVILGGNVRGVSNLQLLKVAHEDSLAVMELDSWQLQGWGWAGISPQIAVFTNFMEDHMNYYHGDMDAYFADKANIFRNQEDTGVLVTTPEAFEQIKAYADRLSPRVTLGLRGQVVLADASVVPKDTLLAMPGEHNRLNAALAYEAVKATSLSDELIFEGLASFGGVEGRLQLVKTTEDQVKIYNDNNATTPAATAAGVRAVAGNKNVVLICGGADKGIELVQLTEAIERHCKKVILIPGTGTDRLVAERGGVIINDNTTLVVENLEQAVEEALLGAENGDIVLFSPGFASFGQYNNEYERNDEFMSLVEKL